MPIIRLEKLLKSNPSSTLNKVVQRAKDMDQLTAQLQAELPAELRDNLLAANLRDDGELVLVCRSSAWASRFRFEGDRLLTVVAQAGVRATRFTVRVGR